MIDKELVVIGGGPAGLAAAISAYDNGIRDILILEREAKLGGILNQCIHNGFGLHFFHEELTGPEYAQRFIDMLAERKIEYKTDTMVLKLSENKEITAVNSYEGILDIKARSVILSMGCRERPRGALAIPGDRCAGIFTAGTAQKYVNCMGYMPGKNVVILGSGDIGLIMARRMTLEGAKVHAVVEIMPYSTGLKRNIVQCLDDFGIPLLLSHTVIDIKGDKRLEGVTIAEVDENRRAIKGTEQYIPCDTLLLSVGLIPENELARSCGVEISPVTGGAVVDDCFETSIKGVFACGNALHVHDLVDYVTEESEKAGKAAAESLRRPQGAEHEIEIKTAKGVRYTVPQTVDPARITEPLKLRFRVDNVYQDHSIVVRIDGEPVMRLKKRILTPGEMETVAIAPKLLQQAGGLRELSVGIEGGAQ